MAIIRGNRQIPKDDDCGCGKPLKLNDPRRKAIKKTVKKRL